MKTIGPESPVHTSQLIHVEDRKVERVWTPYTLVEKTVHQLLDDCRLSKYERCGLVSSNQDLFYIENIHQEPTHNFLMCQDEYNLAVDEIFELGKRVLGIFHTHPNNVVWPTPRDIRGWPDPDLGWHYWIVTNHEVLEWRLV